MLELDLSQVSFKFKGFYFIYAMTLSDSFVQILDNLFQCLILKPKII